MPKNIVLLSDGTGNSSAKISKTNVWRMYEALEAVQRMPVARQTVVAIMPPKDAAQPPVLLGERRVHAPLFRSHRVRIPHIPGRRTHDRRCGRTISP
jgi:hypothetical protein